ncbi:mitochondrial ribosomal death-associated protein 3-domain-containing protein [Apiospora arundinis]|uniref:Small ribosomal subunit protein mS29 n=1 Tax=Apiospora arundinis TaxID=335852 RepID=A0ABR2J9J7_9PEZI
MATANCWRCLGRPSTQRLLAPSQIPSFKAPTSAAAFTTSATLFAKDDNSFSMKGHVRTGKRLVLGKKKKGKTDRSKPPGPGERKAFRKRIQLSNDNALKVSGLPELETQQLADPAAVGQMVSLPIDLVDQLRTAEAFKPTQNWGLFRSPHMLVRKDTVDFLGDLTKRVSNKETVRAVIDGERGVGKSMLGLQTMAAGFMNKMVVINIPEAQDLVEARIDYSLIPRSTPEQFSHPSYILKLMQAIRSANEEVLSKEIVKLEHIHLPVSVSRNSSLASLANATKEPEFAWPVFNALWQELLQPGRPPIMFTLDGLSHIMRISDYRSPSFNLIHAHDMALIRLFVEALGGKTHFPNGAAIVGVMTKGNWLKVKSVEKAIEQAKAAQADLPIPERDAFYSKYDERVFEALKGVEVFDVKSISKPEARSLMEYWAASGVLRMRVDEKTVSERWTLAGNGVLGELERSSLYVSRL